MPKRPAVTVAELKSLLFARFMADQSMRSKLEARFKKELGDEMPDENPEAIKIEGKLLYLISDVLARRLKRNRRSTPLFSSRDLAWIATAMMGYITEADNYKHNPKERKMIEKFIKTMLSESAFEMVRDMVPPRKNIYEEYWRWVKTVLDLAAECGALPVDLLASQEATDEITRRMFTKKQFVALSKKYSDKLTDADACKKAILQPMLAMIPECDKEERRQIEQELEAEIMTQLRETSEKSKVVINAWFGEEVERIYAAA